MALGFVIRIRLGNMPQVDGRCVPSAVALTPDGPGASEFHRDAATLGDHQTPEPAGREVVELDH
jgi:hypothetical protein